MAVAELCGLIFIVIITTIQIIIFTTIFYIDIIIRVDIWRTGRHLDSFGGFIFIIIVIVVIIVIVLYCAEIIIIVLVVITLICCDYGVELIVVIVDRDAVAASELYLALAL